MAHKKKPTGMMARSRAKAKARVAAAKKRRQPAGVTHVRSTARTPAGTPLKSLGTYMETKSGPMKRSKRPRSRKGMLINP